MSAQSELKQLFSGNHFEVTYNSEGKVGVIVWDKDVLPKVLFQTKGCITLAEAMQAARDWKSKEDN